jgi:hypothetical protein
MKTKIQILLALALCLTVSSQGGMEMPNREIPVPKQSVVEAIKLVQDYYDKHGGDPEKIIISVVYGRPDELRTVLGNNFVRGNEPESSWFVTYTHPKKGDSTIIYRLRTNGEIYPLIQANT